MKGKLHLYYDEEGDFLELHAGKFTEGYFKNLGNGIFERIDRKTNEVTGIGIMGFKERTKGPKAEEISLPVEMTLS